MWRQDSGGTWGYGADVGYGYGWRLMAGSIAAYWSDPDTIDHYVFTDSSGADYALRVNTNGIRTSKEGIYISYDPNGQKLYFPDGTVWTMGVFRLAVLLPRSSTRMATKFSYVTTTVTVRIIDILIRG